MTSIREQLETADIQLPLQKLQLLEAVTGALANIEGIAAIVLGGSYAQGTAMATSDMDIGIYYHSHAPFDIERIREVAMLFAAEPPTVTNFYEWGPWVNGGAWIETRAGRVDLLYKNIEQIRQTIEKAKAGQWENNFEQQPPYGFSSIIYLAETQYCVPLWDVNNIIQQLKKEVVPYPPKLKETVVRQSLWSAAFTIWHAGHTAVKGDVFNTIGCLTRAVKDIITALYSLNERYPMGDKRAMAELAATAQVPLHLKEKVEQILCAEKDSLAKNVMYLRALHSEVVGLAGPLYQPYFHLP